MLSFFPRDVLDEIWDLNESVSEGFPTYSYIHEATVHGKTRSNNMSGGLNYSFFSTGRQHQSIWKSR